MKTMLYCATLHGEEHVSACLRSLKSFSYLIILHVGHHNNSQPEKLATANVSIPISKRRKDNLGKYKNEEY